MQPNLQLERNLGFKIEIIQIQTPILFYSDIQDFGVGNKKVLPGTIFFCNWDCFDRHLHLRDQHCSWSKFKLDRRGKSILIAVVRGFGQAGLWCKDNIQLFSIEYCLTRVQVSIEVLIEAINLVVTAESMNVSTNRNWKQVL